MKDEELQLQTISFLRFPLIVGVVFIHSVFPDVVVNGVNLMNGEGGIVYSNVSYLFSTLLSSISVPLFAFFSGFLFFHKIDSFNSNVYLKKIKKRATTLLIPYIFWNLLVIVLYFLSQTFLTELTSGRKKLVVDYTIFDWLWAFWNADNIVGGNSNFPICYQFWYLRDLMITTLFSPLIYFLIKKYRHYFVGCLGILWIFNWWISIPGFNILVLFFFSFGAFYSICKKNFLKEMKPYFPISVILYLLLVIMELCFKGADWLVELRVRNISILVGIVSVLIIVAHYLKNGKWNVNTFIAKSSFFIYAYHGMSVLFIYKLLYKIILPKSDSMMLMLYILCPALVVLGGILFYGLLKRYLPKFTAIITGGR